MLDLLRALLRVESVFDLRDATKAAFAALGFTQAYYVSPVVQDRSEGRLMTNMGFPIAWERAYREAPPGTDPLPDIALRLGRAFRWGKLPEDAVLYPAELDYLKSLEQWDMSDGIGIPAYGPAARVGFVGVGGPAQAGGFETADMEMLRITAETSYLRYCELIVAESDDFPRLSSRELDVLHWMAQGKSNAAIAGELELSQETIDTYVRRIFAKLDVSDRTSAVVKGVTRGLVVASEPKIDAAMRARQSKDWKS